MTATLTTVSGNTTLKFEYTATTAKMVDILGDSAEYLWKEETDEDGKITNPFEDATNQEKVDVIDDHVKQVIINLANTFKSQKAQTLAREAEEASKYII